MNRLLEINTKLQQLNAELISYANTLEFEPVCEFNLDNCAVIIPWNEIVFSGIYFIEIKNDSLLESFPV